MITKIMTPRTLICDDVEARLFVTSLQTLRPRYDIANQSYLSSNTIQRSPLHIRTICYYDYDVNINTVERTPAAAAAGIRCPRFWRIHGGCDRRLVFSVEHPKWR